MLGLLQNLFRPNSDSPVGCEFFPSYLAGFIGDKDGWASNIIPHKTSARVS